MAASKIPLAGVIYCLNVADIESGVLKETHLGTTIMNGKTSSLPVLRARRIPITINANAARVIVRPYIPHTPERIGNIIGRVLKMGKNKVKSMTEVIVEDFSHRHRYFEEILEQNFDLISHFIPEDVDLSLHRKQLIGAYFSAEYSVEAAALFNPSIVQVASLTTDAEGSCRFIMSFRGVGEGHISSIEFRTGIIDSHKDIYFDAVSNYVRTPRTRANALYNRELFRLKLEDLGVRKNATQWLFGDLPSQFTVADLEHKFDEHYSGKRIREQDKLEAIDKARWLARSNYEITFRAEHRISERVIFPISETESGGIEDARFVRFTDDDGSIIYFATYTAFNGDTILPQLIETNDFITFKISTLFGKQAEGKGMALFPRKINGQYVMLSRQDGESNYIMFSDNVHYWESAQKLRNPESPYEFFQMGNGGSPIETPEGWLLITHGVGPMRTYCLGVELLDLDDPTKIICRLEEPILEPNAMDREGYVPNVVYSCGSIIFRDELIIPYAAADQRCGIAVLQVKDLMAKLLNNKVRNRTE
ncbi:MAG: glycoside hydrolase family 130 protein [Gammaproteobacteria bacterium]|nr:glycoside hydrolase family 130 protein [Gammaproteobacteria bacterium]